MTTEIKGGVQGVTCPACEGTGRFEMPDGTLEKCAEWGCNGIGEVMGWAIYLNGKRIESTEQL